MWVAGQCRHYRGTWTLRELVWCYESAVYHQWQTIAGVAAAVLNAQRTKRTDKVWSWIDCHPWHQQAVRRSGREILASAAAALAAEFEWVPGFSPEVIHGSI